MGKELVEGFLFWELEEGAAEPEARKDDGAEGDGEGAAGYPAVEIVRVGSFQDRTGKEVVISSEDLALFVKNFEEGAAQQEVPFDLDHERGKAAGWLKRLWVEGDRLLGQPEWNSIGVELIRGRIYRYLSATIDLTKRVIRAISLVNFPAVKGLKPLELSEGMFTIKIEHEEGTMGEVDLEGLKEQARQEVMAELEAEKKQLVELRAQVRNEVKAELEARYARRATLQEFAEGICGGEAGLSAKPEEVVEFLEGLPEEQVERAMGLLKAKVVDFREHGSEQDDKREKGKKALPEEYGRMLDAGELTLADLSNPILGLEGKLEEYDLSKWEKK